MRQFLFSLLILALAAPLTASALTFRLPEKADEIVGDNMSVTTSYEDTFGIIGRIYGVGFRQMVAANPGINPWVPGEGSEITLPLTYTLPPEVLAAERETIILNLAEFRLYHVLPEKNTVRVYGVGIGREGWQTPVTTGKVLGVAKDPSWTPPESIRQEHAAMGDILPRVVPAGPDNPLGKYAVRLSIPGYLFHGSNKPLGVGMRVSHGCVRLYDGDIEELATSVTIGTPVQIVNEPIKAGWRKGRLYLEVHQALEENRDAFPDPTDVILAAVKRGPEGAAKIDWKKVETALQNKTGLPVDITMDNAL